MAMHSLENDLIDPSLWKSLYDEMPSECKKIVDDPEPQCIGIGRNATHGWFIMASGQGPGLCWQEPDHHRRYRNAWALHQDSDSTSEQKLLLEKEMDSAQNHFGWDEFHEFKHTLAGFEEFWESFASFAKMKVAMMQEYGFLSEK
jgi:hypothetical protein